MRRISIQMAALGAVFRFAGQFQPVRVRPNCLPFDNHRGESRVSGAACLAL